MSFIAKNPLILPEIGYTPSTPPGTRGLFAGQNGWYDVNSDGHAVKITTERDIEDNNSTLKSLVYYGDANIVPSSEHLFAFTVDDETMTASVKFIGFEQPENIIVPYECVLGEKTYAVTSIGFEAFIDCHAIKSIIIPSSITSIDAKAFNECSSLSSITIPKGVTSIGAGVFSYCTSLTNITISKGVTSIELEAFYECAKLTDIYYEGTADEWATIFIDYDNEPLLNATMHFEHVPTTKGYVDEKLKDISVSAAASVYTYVDIPGGVENWTQEPILDDSGNIIGLRYGRIVNVNNAVITPNSKVDLHITSEQMVVFYEKSLAFVAENDDGVITVYCVGRVPENDYRVQAVVTEVLTNG